MQSLRNHFLPRAANFGSRVSDFFRISSRLAGGFRIFLWLALFSTPVLAQPANDNFNLAQDLGNAPAGSVTGDNFDATHEPGEPYLFGGVLGGASVWYTWTAPADGAYTFTTAGSDFDALLGVYTGNTVSNQALIGEGYSLVSFGADLPVMFTAVAGTTYNITVDGYFFGVLEGDIVLSWFTNASTAFAAGDFRFTSDLYLVSESESFFPISGRMHVAGETAPLGPGARLTVTRVQGDKGRVLAGYQVTNTFYTNLYTTNIYGTNVFTTNMVGANTTFTNIFTTNILITTLYQNFEYGQFVYLPALFTLTNISGTNINGRITQTITNYSTNVPIQFVCINDTNTVITVTTDVPPATITMVSNVFCITTNVATNVPSAIAFRDYVPMGGNLTFDDYQMSQDIIVPINPRFGFAFPIINPLLFATITNVALDSLEEQDIPPPTINSIFTNALVSIMSQTAFVDPNGALYPNIFPSFPGRHGTGVPATNVFNFERATLRCTESVNGFRAARVYVLRSTLDARQATSVDYRIDWRGGRNNPLGPYDDSNNTFRNLPGFEDWEIPLQAGSDYAGITNRSPFGTFSDNVHLTPVTGTLNWGANDATPKFIEIPVNDDNVVQFNEDVLVQLYFQQQPSTPATDRSLGYVRTCNLTILFDDQPAGAVDLTYNPNDDPNTFPPYNPQPGPNSTVYALTLQPDGKAILGGDFTSYNGIGVVNNNANIYRFCRVNTDGSLDLSFNNGDGADQFVSAVAVDSNGKIVLGGAFNSINRVSRNRIARVNGNGSLDPTFTPGLGADATVWALAIGSSNSVFLAGQFTNINNSPRHFVARLTPTGAPDPTFDPGVGPNGSVFAMSLQPDGRVLIGGEFTTVDGQPRSRIARLNADGSLDNSFDPIQGFNDNVYSLALQPDGKIVVGGAFTLFQQYVRHGIIRLNADGSLDNSFTAGDGISDTVYSLALQSDNRILAAGIFKSCNQTRRVGITRLLTDGIVDTTFMDTAYNQFAGLPNHYYNPAVEAPNFIFALAQQTDGAVLIAGNFARVGGGGRRDDIRNRNNFCRLIGGSTPGPGNITLTQDQYSANETGDTLFITMSRDNGHLGPAAVSVTPITLAPGPGAAVFGQDFTFDFSTYGTPTWITSYPVVSWHLGDGLFGPNNGSFQGCMATVDPNVFLCAPPLVYVTLLDNTNMSGNRQLTLELDNPGDNDQFLLGGEKVPLGVALGRSSATITIIDPHTLAGVLGFSSPTYTVNETTNATIFVTRTNGSTGLVTVNFQTLNGTATNGVHYRTNYGRLDFHPGELVKSFTVTNINESIKEGDHTVNLRLFNPSGGATLGLSNSVLTIIDNDIPGGYAQFTSTNYFTNEDAVFAQVVVTRNGSSAGTLTAQFATSNGTATNGFNYLGFTNTLTWNNGDVDPKVIPIQILDDNVVETNNLTVNLRLFGFTFNGTNVNQPVGITNSLLTISNSDFRGVVQFSTDTYKANENGGPAFITVVRTGGSSESITVNFATLPGSASPGIDFIPTNGAFSFGPGEVSKTFAVPILDNAVEDLPRFITLSLTNASPVGSLGSPSTAIINIIDDESFNEPPGGLDTAQDPSAGFNDAVLAMALQPDGKLVAVGDFTTANAVSRNRIARLNADGSLDQSFSSTSPLAGADASVRTVLSQTDQRILIGGTFTNVNSTARNHLARLASNAALDTTFNPGTGPDNDVFAVAESFIGTSRKLLVGGAFTSFNTTPRNYICRLNDNGSLDASFDPGLGANGSVFAIALQSNGKVLIGGDFTFVNGVGRNHLARLNSDGSVDLSFNPFQGANDSVRAITIQSDGRILIGGLFTSFSGASLNHIARLRPNGAVDTTFTPGVGANDSVTAITVQPDTRILLGGQFTLCNGVTRHHLTRLNNDGTVDTTINFGDGADSFVASVLIETNGLIDLGGGFTHYDGEPRNHIARIYGGSIAGSGTFEFTAANYQVTENGTNATVTVRRRGGTSGAGVSPAGNVFVTFNTSDGTAVSPINYLGLTNALAFPPGEVFQNVTIPIIDDFLVNSDRTFTNTLSNPQPPDGPGLGNQPTSVVTIINDDSAISFSAATYSRSEDAIDGKATIPILRFGSTNNAASVTFLTLTNGTAVPGVNFTPVTNIVSFAPGQTNAIVQVPIFHNPAIEGDKTVPLLLSNAVGALLQAPSQATLTIVDVDSAPGQLFFSATNYVGREGGTNVLITVLRTNGHSHAVSVHFATRDGSAIAGTHYVATNGFLAFGDGETNKSFSVPLIDDNLVQGNLIFSVALDSPTGGATILAPTNVPVTILDNDVGVTLSAEAYSVSEAATSVTISVLRLNGSNSVLSVHYATADGSATAGADYGSTSGTLTFATNETLKTFTIPISQDSLVEGDETFTVTISNLQPPGAAQFVTSTATVTILDDDVGFFFASNGVYSVSEGGTNVLLTVLCTNALAITGSNVVNFLTVDGTATAGADYTAVNGSLIFTNGQNSATISVPIREDTLVEGDETFSVTLTNATGGAQVLSPSNAVVTILDDDSGLRFSSPTYLVNEAGVLATITVLRTGVLTNTVSVDFATTNGTAIAGVHYFPASGTLTFTNGETAKSFNVQVIDETVIEGDHTVLLGLSNPFGQASLVSPSAAVLTIIDNDGSLIVPAGAALLSDTTGAIVGPNNGIIDPGETVSLLFALRNSIGSSTTNLVATLLATNGVTNPRGTNCTSPATNYYGRLDPGGPSRSRQFCFTALGTNGQQIAATFQLQDGPLNLGTATFPFTLGSSTATFSNSAPIVINDFTNASPYPSSITVSGLNGVITKATVTLTNLSHASAADIDALLASPAGQRSVLLGNNGGLNSISHVPLTLDDSAATPVPIGGTIVSGTNRPNPSLPVPVFPAPAPPMPYATNLYAFTNFNPNGVWSLFIIDDANLDAGSISNGWVLTLTTANVIAPVGDLAVTLAVPPSPPFVGGNFTNTISVTNYGPSPVTSVTVSDVVSSNATFVFASPSSYQLSTNNSQLTVTFTNLGSLAKDAFTTLTVVVRPTALGPLTNTVTVAAAESDPNAANNTASVTANVVSPTADMVLLSLVGSPNPVTVGSPLTYSIVVSNAGPAVATTVKLTNTLPAGVTFLSATPSNAFTLVGSVLTFTNLGNLAAGVPTNATIIVQPLAAGTITNSASVGSSVTDPLKANNSASVKTVVEAVALAMAHGAANSCILSWPAAGSYVLESAASLKAPVTWTQVTNPAPQLVGDQRMVTITMSNSIRFFRLRAPAP